MYYECECQDGAMTTGSGGNVTCVGKVYRQHFLLIILCFLSKILMSVKRILISVVWEHVVIMMMEHSMSVNVKMEL